MSHTYSILEISQAAFNEIKQKLEEAGYLHVFHGEAIDMHGIAVAPQKEGRCETCGGDGRVWEAWAGLPPISDLAVRMGVVKPQECPTCKGKG